MKPAAFEYHRPETLDQALELLAEHGDEAKILAGGQSLVPTMNFRLAQPEQLIDINRLSDLAFIREDKSGLRIGAITRQRAVERSELVAKRAPLVHQTMPYIAHVQIRNRGTFGGSVAHADPAAELPCIMLALDARMRVQSKKSERWIAANDFFVGLLETALSPEELLTEIEVPDLPKGTGYAFVEFARRHGDYALVGVAVRVELNSKGACENTRVVLMSVGERPVDGQNAAAALNGEQPSTEAIGAAARAAGQDDIDPHSDVHANSDYRRHLAEVLTARALKHAIERARG